MAQVATMPGLCDGSVWCERDSLRMWHHWVAWLCRSLLPASATVQGSSCQSLQPGESCQITCVQGRPAFCASGLKRHIVHIDSHALTNSCPTLPTCSKVIQVGLSVQNAQLGTSSSTGRVWCVGMVAYSSNKVPVQPLILGVHHVQPRENVGNSAGTWWPRKVLVPSTKKKCSKNFQDLKASWSQFHKPALKIQLVMEKFFFFFFFFSNLQLFVLNLFSSNHWLVAIKRSPRWAMVGWSWHRGRPVSRLVAIAALAVGGDLAIAMCDHKSAREHIISQAVSSCLKHRQSRTKLNDGARINPIENIGNQRQDSTKETRHVLSPCSYSSKQWNQRVRFRFNASCAESRIAKSPSCFPVVTQYAGSSVRST